MGIDFHNQKNRITYTTRTADKTWIEALKNLVPTENIAKALDIGCGGGIYTKALSDIVEQVLIFLKLFSMEQKKTVKSIKIFHLYFVMLLTPA